MGEEPERIRAEIEQTRAEMSETVDAIGNKADVKTRAKENLQEKKQSAKESIVGVKDRIVGAGDSVTGTVSDRTPDPEQVKHKPLQAKSVAQQNPLGLAIGSVAVGFLAGMLIPSTKVEDQKIGPIADAAKDSGQQHAQEVKESAQQSAQELQDQQSSGSTSAPTYQTR